MTSLSLLAGRTVDGSSACYDDIRVPSVLKTHYGNYRFIARDLKRNSVENHQRSDLKVNE